MTRQTLESLSIDLKFDHNKLNNELNCNEVKKQDSALARSGRRQERITLIADSLGLLESCQRKLLQGFTSENEKGSNKQRTNKQ